MGFVSDMYRAARLANDMLAVVVEEARARGASRRRTRRWVARSGEGRALAESCGEGRGAGPG